jgi:ribosomal protein L29
VARLRNVSLENLAQETTENASKLFKLNLSTQSHQEVNSEVVAENGLAYLK